jgi:riboflavin synthase
MFTGLIADLGSVTALQRSELGATVEIRTPLAQELTDGDSIAVNGVCLTAVSVHDGSFQAQAMAETLARSSLGALRAGARVNLELALRVGDRLGGHVVQGHVDGTGTVTEIREEGFARVLGIEIDPQLQRYLTEKGSVAVDGVSLTVSALHEHGFAVSLIPETLGRTNLGSIGEGALVNVEVDIIAKHVERLMNGNRDPLAAGEQRS